MSTGILNYTTSLRDYLWEKGIEEHPSLKELRLETAKLPQSMMQICPEQGALMANLIRLMSAYNMPANVDFFLCLAPIRCF